MTLNHPTRAQLVLLAAAAVSLLATRCGDITPPDQTTASPGRARIVHRGPRLLPSGASASETAIIGPRRAATAGGQGQVSMPAGLRRSMAATLQRDASPAYRIIRRPGSALAHGADNPATRMAIAFSPVGPRVSPSTAAAGQVAGSNWSLGLSLARVGYGAQLRPVAAVQQRVAAGNRLEYRRGPAGSGAKPALVEWYVNGPLGLEQGFTLRAPPEGHRSGPLLLEMVPSGGLIPTLVHDPGRGSHVRFSTPRGRAVLRYSELHVHDHGGAQVPARLSLAGGRIRIEVQDRGARYPLTIDPLLTTESWARRLTGGAGDQLGRSVALAGTTAVVGAPYVDSGTNKKAGAAYVFDLNGAAWTLRQKLTAPDAGAHDFFGDSVAIHGDTLVVGAYSHSSGASDTGAAYVFTRKGTSWTLQQKLTDAVPIKHTRIGRWVALDGDTALISGSSPRVFVRAGTSWTLQQKLTASDGGSINGSVALDGNTAVVGASFAKIGVMSSAGAAYVFVRSGTTWTQQQKLTAADADTHDRFGESVSLDGDTVVVGAVHDNDGGSDSGSAYVFVRAGSNWIQRQKLTASDAAADDNFGHAVSLDGDAVVVGAKGDDDSGSNSGSAYVFTRSGSSWTQQQKITASDAGPGDYLGWAVALDGDTVAAGACLDNIGASGSGAAYIFTRSKGTWSQRFKLAPGDAAAGDHAGFSVSIDGDSAVVGAHRDADGGYHSGSAYVFVRSKGAWTQQQKLIAKDAAAEDRFGQSVSIHKDTVVVGAPSDDDGGSSSGSVYVYVRTKGTWAQQQKLTASDAAAGDLLGVSVSISGDTVVAGANGDDDGGNAAGAAYVFVRSKGSWTQQQKLTASDAADNYSFGASVSIHGHTVIAGARQYVFVTKKLPGAAYVFARSGTSWTQQQKLTAADAAPDDRFGDSVSIHGDTAVVGAAEDDDAGSGSGSAYVFLRTGTSWTQQQKLTAADAAPDEQFGDAVSIYGDTVVVGATGDDDGGTDSGSAYVFVRGGTSWSQRTKLTASDAAAKSKFGISVAVSGKIAMVGARQAADDGFFEAGKAYLYRFLIKDRGETCAQNNECLNLTCFGGVCCNATCQDACKACVVPGKLGRCSPRSWGVQVTSGANTCGGAKVCDGLGACKKKIGQACSTSAQCVPGDKTKLTAGGSCVDGACCGVASCATCETCNVSGSAGQCKPVPANKTDDVPVGTCSGKYACDGAGKCKEGLGRSCSADTVCASDHCTDNVCCDSKCLATCSSCAVVGQEGTCSPITGGPDLGCSGVCQVCSAGKCTPQPAGKQVTTGGQTCSGALICDGTGFCKKKIGTKCNNGLECASNHCVDGVCCKTACDKTCMSCKLAGSVGTCAAIKAKQDPDKECIGSHPKCGGACDGKGQCEFPGAGSGCGTCMACDGTGRCSGSPPDDTGCGIIDCDKLDTTCRDYHDLKSGRCSSFGVCKPANDAVTCNRYTNLACPDAGAPDAGKDLGSLPDRATTVHDGEDPGCNLAARAQGTAPSGGALAAYLLAIIGFAVARRRRRQREQA